MNLYRIRAYSLTDVDEAFVMAETAQEALEARVVVDFRVAGLHLVSVELHEVGTLVSSSGRSASAGQ